MKTEKNQTAAAPVFLEGEGAGVAKETAGDTHPLRSARKKHYRTYLTKDVINEYKARGGMRIVLSFVEMHGNEVGLGV